MNKKKYIIGADEVGYGSFAGPLVVCAFKAPSNWTYDGLRDSKKLSNKKRTSIWGKLVKECEVIKDNDICSTYSSISNDLIDKMGLGVARDCAFIDAISKIYDNDSEVICDGTLSFYDEVLIQNGINPNNITSVIKADDKIPTVMAASILAKVYRDLIMCKYSKEFPEYGFDKHKGYGTKQHKDAIRQFGFSKIHRTSYKIKL